MESLKPLRVFDMEEPGRWKPCADAGLMLLALVLLENEDPEGFLDDPLDVVRVEFVEKECI